MAKKKTRRYSETTIKVLFALSGNQCAHPECSNTLIENATEQSEAIVSGHICHIYAISEDGPRGTSGLTEEELNSPENLVLMCRHHHGIVDGQHETYPAEMLKEWKKIHEEKMRKRLSSDLDRIKPEILSHPYFPKSLVDQKIKEEISLLIKSRFFVECERIAIAKNIGNRLLEGELSGGSNSERCFALAWCARLLARTDDLAPSEKYLSEAKILDDCPEIAIAEAFLISQKGDKANALSMLAQLNTPASRSAAFMIAVHHDGKENAIKWLDDTETNISDLSAEGKYFLLAQQLDIGDLSNANKTANNVNQSDLEEAPVLYHMLAVTKLSNVVPEEFCSVVLYQLPFDAAEFPLASDEASIDTRKMAQKLFEKASDVALRLNCPKAAGIDKDYALWLELRDKDNSSKGMEYLENQLRNTSYALRFVPLALQFGIKLDLTAIEKEINRQISLHGDITLDTACARFALAFVRKKPGQVAEYIEQHYDQLSKYINPIAMRSIQIEMYAKANSLEKANKCFENLLEEGLTDAEESRLRRIISEAEGSDPIETRIEQFNKTDSLTDLVALVGQLNEKERWNDLCKYGLALFQRTRSIKDAENFVYALHKCLNSSEIIVFIDKNIGLLEQSKTLKYFYAWAMFDEGEFVKAKKELKELNEDRESQNYRTLQINLAIAMGDWNSIPEIVAYEFSKRDQRSALELLRTAQLALNIGSSSAKELLFAAVEKAGDDASILSAAYFLASNAGFEGDVTVAEWLHRAAALSSENGPIQIMSTKDILDRKPEWDRRESETWKLLNLGNIPIFLAAQSLNKTLVDHILFPSLLNLNEPDPRRRSAIPAFSGNRQPVSFKPEDIIIGIDATALLTLASVGFLGKVLDSFKSVYLSHTILAWLFDEKQKVAFHQPSRVKDAYKVRDLVSRELLQKLTPETTPDSDLSAQVGDELSQLISEASQSDSGDIQRLVVRSSPVHRVSTFMEEEADLSPYEHIMCSCLAVVEKLREKGQITHEDELIAKDYLSVREKPWPKQPEINDKAYLYLDELSITYLLHLGLLDKLHGAGFRAIASPREISESNALISYEGLSERVNPLIEEIRSAIHSRIESGKVKIGKGVNPEAQDDKKLSEHPTSGIFLLGNECDGVIIDDRFFNQHSHIGEANNRMQVYTSLDMLNALHDTNVISLKELFGYRTLLRKSGFFCIPISEDELLHYLNSSSIKKGKILESAELKAIRENVLKVRMSDWLQLPKEAYWLNGTMNVFFGTLKKLWSEEIDIDCSIAKSNWIYEQLDIRGWAHRLVPEIRENIVGVGRGSYILMLLFPPTNATKRIRESYFNWVEEKALKPLKIQFPEVYDWVIQWEKESIKKMVDEEFDEGENQ